MIKLAVAVALAAVSSSALAHKDCFDIGASSEPCRVYVHGANLAIYSTGELTQGQNEARVPLPDGFFLENAEVESLGSATLLILGFTNIEASSTILALIDAQTLKVRWTTQIGAFNASPALVSDSSIYVAGIGTVAKVRLLDGKLIWIHKHLYDRDTQAYNSFVRPRKEAGTIVFTENKVGNYPTIREVRVDDKTGKLLAK